MPKKETKFHGILAVGRTKTDAINNYRLLAMSKGAAVQVDSERNIAFVTQASNAEGMFNPMSGNMDLETDEEVLNQLEFASNSSGDVEVNHLVCQSGCGAHIVFDSEELVKFCPHCTSALSSDEGDEGGEDSDDVNFDDDEDDDSDIEDDAGDDLDSESSDEESEEDSGDEDSGDEDSGDEEAEDDSGDEESDEEAEDDSGDEDKEAEPEAEPLPELGDNDGEIVISSDDDSELVVAASSLDEATNLFRKHLPITSVSSGSSNIEAHYKVCASDTCGAHLVSTEDITECPACHSEAVEPETEKSEDATADTDSVEDDEHIVIAADSFADAVKILRKQLPTTSVSSDTSNIEVHYKVCASDDCGAHVVSTQDIDECPACKSELDEPEQRPTIESSDDEDSDDMSDEGAEGDEESEENTLELSDDDGNILDEDTDEVDAMNDVDDEESESSSDLDVSYSSAVAGKPVWTAFYKGMPIAIASKESAGKNADMFDTPSFGHAVLATAKISGVKKALGELGFAAIKHKVSISKAVRRMVETQVAEARASISAEQQQFKERFAAALAASAVGLNRGFFADKKNPIKAALWNSMSSAGIRNPESLIDVVFKSHSDAYHKVLFELASELTAKPVEVQESLSKAIHGMSYQEVSSASGETIEGRLETMGTSVSSGVDTQNAQPTGAVDRQQISNAVKSLGRRGR